MSAVLLGMALKLKVCVFQNILHVPDCKIDIFAEDKTIYFSHKDLNLINNVLQNELNNIKRWCDVNKLVINVTKTKAMVISTHQKRSRYGSVELNFI